MSYTILRNDSISANIENNNTITSGNKSELLSLVLETKLSLESHINNPCKEASQNLSALARIAKFKINAMLLGSKSIIMLLSSKSIGGSLKDLHSEYARLFRASGVFTCMKLFFSKLKLKYYHYYQILSYFLRISIFRIGSQKSALLCLFNTSHFY